MVNDSFEAIIGNTAMKRYLTIALNKGRLGKSLLFCGPEGVGKSLFAKQVACALMSVGPKAEKHREKILCGSHPDVRVYRPEGKIAMHTIDSMRRFQEEVNLAPLEANQKLFIIEEAHRMLTYSANALLKTFEEPPKDTSIILISHQPQALLPTILSRCQRVVFCAIPDEEIAQYLRDAHEMSEEESRRIAQKAQGSLGRALALLECESDPKEQLLYQMLSDRVYCDYPALKSRIEELVKLIEAEVAEQVEEFEQQRLEQFPEDLTAAHKQQITKEMDGVGALLNRERAEEIFKGILAWFRDLQLLALHGNEALLWNSDSAVSLRQLLQKEQPRPIERVEEWVKEAQLAHERSTPLIHCLEGLFLKIAG